MKRIKIILTFITAFALAAIDTSAQGTSAAYKMKSSTGVDSVISAGVTPNYLYTPTSLNYRCASIQTICTRITAAQGGTINIEASNDATNYIPVPVNLGDTITITNAATSSDDFKFYPDKGVIYKNYRIKIVNASGDTSTVKAYFNGRQ